MSGTDTPGAPLTTSRRFSGLFSCCCSARTIRERRICRGRMVRCGKGVQEPASAFMLTTFAVAKDMMCSVRKQALSAAEKLAKDLCEVMSVVKASGDRIGARTRECRSQRRHGLYRSSSDRLFPGPLLFLRRGLLHDAALVVSCLLASSAPIPVQPFGSYT